MYNEYNGYNIYLESFSFPLNFGVSDVSIDCAEWWFLSVIWDETQNINCIYLNGQSYILQNSFSCSNPSWCSLELKNQDPTSNISFWEIIIVDQVWYTLETQGEDSIFTSVENIRDFYIAELVFFLIIVFFIFIRKFFK